MHDLTEKQKRFADYYIKSGNATQSYIDAGYSASKREVAEVNAHKLLRNHKVKSYIDERNKALESDRIADMREVKEFWTSTLRNDKADYRDRLKASEYIAKTNGAFLDKVEHTGHMTIEQILDEISDD